MEPERSDARAAGLRYVTDQESGLSRRGKTPHFAYRDADGRAVRDAETLSRIRSLAIPPAWTDVWICASPLGHLQATGRDAKGRKQYRYHPRWRSIRDNAKYDRMIAFGQALPRIRERVNADLASPGLTKTKVLATIVRLLESTLIRVGNDEYARANHSYGLTTLRARHVAIERGTIHFHFRGKSGVRHSIDLNDRRLASIVRQCRELPGQHLFQYVDETGALASIGSSDVNEYLHEIAGEEFTAKDFRTWAGTVLAALAFQEFERCETEREIKSSIVQAIESVAKRLGNTPSICRKCYVHPAVIDSFRDGELREVLSEKVSRAMRRDLSHLKPEEAAVLALLQRRFVTEAPARSRRKPRRRSEAASLTASSN